MKTRSFVGWLALAAMVPVVVFAAEAKKSEKAPVEPPAIKVDTSPVGEGGVAGRATSYADVVEPVQKAVVSVYSTKIVRQQMQVDPFFRQFFGNQIPGKESRQEGLGSGVIVAANGYILTNNHVVADADELNVQLSDGREFKAKVIGTDEQTDVAVIKIEVDDLPVITLADSDKLRVGDIVFAVGNPLGVGQTVTMGIVSATGRTSLGLLENVGGYENFIQTDASINQGNSGGALVDAKGRLVGINTAIVSQSRGNIGIGFAIPVNQASSVMHSLLATGKAQRGYLGVASQTLDPEVAEALGLKRDVRGVMITDVNKDTPAAEAGLKRNDVITKINGRSIASLQDLRVTVAQMAPGSEVTVVVLREAKEKTFKVKLGLLPDSLAVTDELVPGVKAAPLDAEARRRLNLRELGDYGLLITEVDPTSPFAERLAADMVVLQVNKVDVGDLKAAKAAMRPGLNLMLVYHRGVIRGVPFTLK